MTKKRTCSPNEGINYLTTVLYGTWTPPPILGHRIYIQGKLKEQSGVSHYGYGQLDSVILLALRQSKPYWMSRNDIADEIDVAPYSLLRPLRDLAKKGVIKSKALVGDRGRPAHVYRLP